MIERQLKKKLTRGIQQKIIPALNELGKRLYNNEQDSPETPLSDLSPNDAYLVQVVSMLIVLFDKPLVKKLGQQSGQLLHQSVPEQAGVQ